MAGLYEGVTPVELPAVRPIARDPVGEPQDEDGALPHAVPDEETRSALAAIATTGPLRRRIRMMAPRGPGGGSTSSGCSASCSRSSTTPAQRWSGFGGPPAIPARRGLPARSRGGARLRGPS